MFSANAQQSGWENNIYVLTTTRIFVVAGAVYLCRSLYYLVARYSGPVIGTSQITPASSPKFFDQWLREYEAKASRYSVGTSQGQVGVDLTIMASDTLSMASMDPDMDIIINDDLELGLQQPRRSYQSHHYLYRPRAHRDERPQRTEASTISHNPIAAAEQRTNSRSGPANLATDQLSPIT